MIRLKYVLLFVFVATALFGCNPNTDIQTPVQTLTVQSQSDYINPYPLQVTADPSANTQGETTQPAANLPYPEPEKGGEVQVVSMFPENFVKNLDLPSPDNDLGILTGTLLKADEPDKPYISAIYLAPAKPSGNASTPPRIDFSKKSNLLAVQDLENGQFMFPQVIPGQYAIVIWNPGGSFFLEDGSGNIIIVEAKADNVTDLGMIYFK